MSLAYNAVCVQRWTNPVNGLSRSEARQSILDSIDLARREVEVARAGAGDDARLFLFPEFSFQGYPVRETFDEWIDLACIEPEGVEYERFSSMARELGVYLGGHTYEFDRKLPGVYFGTTWLFDDKGELRLRYRRLNSMTSPSPYDVWDKFLEHYTIDDLLPVAKTELGNFAAIPCQEIHFPELIRSLALRGAEILLHPTSEHRLRGQLTTFEVARRARATENVMYIVSSNSAGLKGDVPGGNTRDGGSEIVDYRGNVMKKAGPGSSFAATAEIDLAALRRRRSKPDVWNLLSRTQTQLWGEEYLRHEVVPPNTALQPGVTLDRQFFKKKQAEITGRFYQH